MQEKIVEFFEKYRIILILNLCFVLIVGILLYFWSNKKDSDTKSSANIRVEITGAVKNPGLYNLGKGAIVEDLISKAGGLSDSVNKTTFSEQINRAEILSDGQKVVIPQTNNETAASQQIAGASTTSSTNSQNSSTKTNINSATLAQLDSLPGIGPTYAQRIIDYRNTHGGFKSIQEIKNVKGIGDKTFEKFSSMIKI